MNIHYLQVDLIYANNQKNSSQDWWVNGLGNLDSKCVSEFFLNFRKVIWCIHNIVQQSQWGLGQYPVIEQICMSAMRYMNSHTGINLCDKQNYKLSSVSLGQVCHKISSDNKLGFVIKWVMKNLVFIIFFFNLGKVLQMVFDEDNSQSFGKEHSILFTPSPKLEAQESP